ncbi:CDGSH iron-sulfur domain-containing protein 2 homolog A-like [Anneissia japonica]|uniref:CDGSH iron-sulfur domain-containing protein 2 homolog A-like n=1 Tax=Anneissia japonica TaxID=1529436 RepID=UPI0014258BCF|nr:CDGSH iron-sulfur domain-containing protein 2 homolog A-like [Anneissia japonica]
MESIKLLLTVTFPNYLQSLPIPDTLGGFADLTGSDMLRLVPIIGTLAAAVYLVVSAMTAKKDEPPPPPKVNYNCVDGDKDKVVHSFDVEDLGNKTCFCRCWRSKKFPYCDGSHNKHNDACCDNVGPLIIQKPEKSS